MSSGGPPQRPSIRSKLRNSTVIVPRTGERSHRQFTLSYGHSPPRPLRRSSSSADSSSSSSSSTTTAANDDDLATNTSSSTPVDLSHSNRIENNSHERINNPVVYRGTRNRSATLPTTFWTSALHPSRVLRQRHVHRARRRLRITIRRTVHWLSSPVGHGVLKCTLAYAVASLAIFWAPLSNFLGKPDGKHVVATITVYFNPARSAGSMIEAVLLAIVAVAYALAVSLLSMVASFLVGARLGQVEVAHALVLVVFIGGGFGLIGWVKQRRNDALVNTASTLASLAIISVITKEDAVRTHTFSYQKIVQVLKMLAMAITITTAVNLLLWRVSARAQVRRSITIASASLAATLAAITRAFLLGAEDDMLRDDGGFTSSARFPELLKTLREAKFEHYFVGHEAVYVRERAVVKTLESLAQCLGGLRSAANTQFSLLKELPLDPYTAPPIFDRSDGAPSPLQPQQRPSTIPIPLSGSSNTVVFAPYLLQSPTDNMDAHIDTLNQAFSSSPITEEASANQAPRQTENPGVENAPTSLTSSHDPQLGAASATPAVFRSPSDIFELFITLLGPSLKSLAYTLSEILREPPFPPDAHPPAAVLLNPHFHHSLTAALAIFRAARADALTHIYHRIGLDRAARMEPAPAHLQADFEEVAAACGHFSFALLALGHEMERYLDRLEELKFVEEYKRRRWVWMTGWWWTRWRRGSATPAVVARDAVGEEAERRSSGGGLPADEEMRIVQPIKKTALPRGIPDHMRKRRDTRAWEKAPEANHVVATFSQKLLGVIRKVARDDVRFGIKVGIGAVLWAQFAFIAPTRDFYQHWRGEWGLLSFMIVCSMTVGASNTTGLARFIGTLMGATASVVNWNLTGGDAVALLVLGALVSFANFYLIIARGQGPLGRISLLAYNVSTLYAYSLSHSVDDDDDDEGGLDPLIFTIVMHRALAVTAGILWGLIVCRVIWPISARKKFKQGIAVLFLQLGLIWKRGPLTVLLQSPPASAAESASPPSRNFVKPGEQLALLRYAARLESLLHAASNEFDLRGPFPAAPLARILSSIERILDAFCAMSQVTRSRPLLHGHSGAAHDSDGDAGGLTPGERALLRLTECEAADLGARLCHVFQALASSLMLEALLTDQIPSVVHTRDRFLGHIFQVRKAYQAQAQGGGEDGAAAAGEQEGEEVGNGRIALPPGVVVEESDYALLYAYALITGQVAEELKRVEKELDGLYGKLGDEFLLQ